MEMMAYDQMTRARANLLIEQPFFGTLAIKLKLVETEDIPTAGTDMERLVFNPKFIAKQSSHQTLGLVAHEVMHCVLSHPLRRGERDPELWNVACDHAINLHLLEQGFILPDGGIHDEQYRDMTAEAIYNMLGDDDRPSKGKNPPMWGLVMDPGQGSLTPTSGAALEADWNISIQQAAEVARAAGKLPGSLSDLVGAALEPKIDWRTVMWPFFTDMIDDDYTWRKPNRAYISEDEYLPSMYAEGLGEIAVIFDTSGSCVEYAQTFWSEAAAVMQQCAPQAIHILQCDTDVTDAVTLDKGCDPHEYVPELKGGGGTMFSPAFDYISEHYPDVVAVVYLTDLESNDFGDEPEYPVLWVSTEKHEAPWGTVTYMEDA